MAGIAESQAGAAWDILTALAAEGPDSATYRSWPGRITYEELAEKLGNFPRGLVPVLEPIMMHCRARGLPPLTGLVVLKDKGVPSDGFPLELTPALPSVHTFDWSSVENPFT